jgi:outer membrane lipoprotein carrier protein
MPKLRFQENKTASMKNLLLLLALLTISSGLLAQSAAPAEKSDPEAKKVLDKIRKKYEGFKTMEAGFTLTIELPGQPREIQKGTIAQQDAKFRLDMAAQMIVSDGKSTWVYLKQNKEVQINDAEPADSEGAFLTPRDLLRRYEKGDFLYAITDKITENGKLLTQIEFKPVDRNSEYSKLRLSIDEKAGTIESVRAFAKDGSRYIFQISGVVFDKTFPAAYFSFDKSKYPGVHVEDLRL